MLYNDQRNMSSMVIVCNWIFEQEIKRKKDRKNPILLKPNYI